MFDWNPHASETQFFFDDCDVKTRKVFTVLYDLEKRKRVCEFHFDESPIGNAGGSGEACAFLALNDECLARLRLVTGYPDALDWSAARTTPLPLDSGRLTAFLHVAGLVDQTNRVCAGVILHDDFLQPPSGQVLLPSVLSQELL